MTSHIDHACEVGVDAGHDLLSYGLSLVGFPPSRQNVRESLNKERFRAFYGVNVDAVSSLFECMYLYYFDTAWDPKECGSRDRG